MTEEITLVQLQEAISKFRSMHTEPDQIAETRYYVNEATFRKILARCIPQQREGDLIPSHCSRLSFGGFLIEIDHRLPDDYYIPGSVYNKLKEARWSQTIPPSKTTSDK